MIVLIVWVAGMCLAGWIGHRKGMASLGWGLGAIIGWLGAIIMACIPRRFAPVWQGWMARLAGRGRIIAGVALLLVWAFVPSISRNGVSISEAHAECQSGLGIAEAFGLNLGINCGDVSTLYAFLTLALVAGLALVLWGVWAAWGATLVEKGREFSATARPAPPAPPQYPLAATPPAPAPPRPSGPGGYGVQLRDPTGTVQTPPAPAPPPPVVCCTCGADHESGDTFCHSCGRRVWSPAPGPA